MMKRFLSVTLLAVTAIALVACGSDDELNDSGEFEETGIAVSGVGGTIAGCVDLGLPSGTLWATHNIGASKESEYGAYIAWGEVGSAEEGYVTGIKTDKSKGMSSNKYSYYDWSNYSLSNGTYSGINKYINNASFGTVDNKTTLELCDDAAYVNWGSKWCMPTEDQIEELVDTNYTSCKWIQAGNTEFDGVAGYKIQSKVKGHTGKYIFLPAAGFRDDSTNYVTGTYGYYWSSSLYSKLVTSARLLLVGNDYNNKYSGCSRECGASIRPVRASK